METETIISETEKELMKSEVLSDSNKSLHDLTSKELGQLFPIIILDYTDKWVNYYQTESQLITNAFMPSEIISIDHIGSTAIPGLKAKPTVDILLQISEQIDNQKLINVFQSIGYQLNTRPDKPPPHMTFVKGYSPHGFKGQAFHVHIRYKGDWDEIRFRDYLINHTEIAKEYESLKLKLADKYKNEREKYTDLKTDFIQKVNKLTRK
ncbi:MAG: GrpB family protein [Ignavibacteria bacterium]|nr:GrpB family protein [Ignavibacteria bacterium]